MADVKLDWLIPAGSVNMSNIDSFVIYKKASATCADLQTLATSNDTVYKLPVTGTGTTGGEITDKTLNTYTDTEVAAGTYTYGIYAKNAGGISPCKGTSGADSVTTVTVS